MTEDYCPTDNAIAERVNGIIKQKWLYRMKRPKDRNEAQKLICGIIDFYNKATSKQREQDAPLHNCERYS